ncbi:MAG TPA: NifB/NifX family molybdenum-iron cluster-binding protein [Acidobacteriota bacterium]|nr:NifB/NifX family molybdenum-iron cluster-binding protein [Acidobacteriota bacterium]
MDSTIHEHFGSAPYFTLYDTETEEINVIENRNAHHSHGTCHPMSQLARYHIDAVLCSGMGRRAIEALNAEGIRTLDTDVTATREAVRMFSEGSLSDIESARACHGRGQRYEGTTDRRVWGRGTGRHQGAGDGQRHRNRG